MKNQTLIAYFSYTEHTRGIAKLMQSIIGADLFEIRPEIPYSDDYDTCEAQARKETSKGYQPHLESMCDNLLDYDTILLGTPNWFNTVAPPVAAFLSESDLRGKTLIPFCTNGGGGLGHIVRDIKKMCGGAEVREALRLYEDGGANAESKIIEWLKNNQYSF